MRILLERLQSEPLAHIAAERRKAPIRSFLIGFALAAVWHVLASAGVTMTEDDLEALRLLLREELQAELKPLRAEVGKRFDKIASHIDGLFQRDEKREQEYFSIREQIKRLEQSIA